MDIGVHLDPLHTFACARHGRELLGLKSAAGEPVYVSRIDEVPDEGNCRLRS